MAIFQQLPEKQEVQLIAGVRYQAGAPRDGKRTDGRRKIEG
jgi:hypothetical protein